MAKSLDQTLTETDDFELCDGIFNRIIERYGEDLDAAELPDEERTVLLVWHVAGIIGNGGFRSLFEHTLRGDPFFIRTSEAYLKIDCRKAAEAIKKELAVFPNSRPPRDAQVRLRHYLKSIQSTPTEMDEQFFQANDDVTRCLAAYIRSHRQALMRLDQPVSHERPRDEDEEETEESDQEQNTGPSLEDLPHWARVAFAARCARQVYPLLSEHWPGVPARYSEGVLRAIDLAEASACEGIPVDGLEDATRKALMAAGAPLATGPLQKRGEPIPADAYSGTIASYIAKAAEKAAECARANVDDSVRAAREAWSFAQDAAKSSEADSIATNLQKDFVRLWQAADHGAWTDRIAISPEIWNMI